MKKPTLAVVLLLVFGCWVQADVLVRAAEITAFGVFEERGRVFERGYTATAPGTDSLEQVRFVGFDRQIAGEVGTSFGIEYIVHSRPKGRPMQVTAIILYPEAGLISPAGDVYHRSEETMYIKPGEENFYGFGFDEPWEIVPGEWTFQIRYKQAIIARKTFTVLEPVKN